VGKFREKFCFLLCNISVEFFFNLFSPDNQEVGDISPKGRVGDSRLASVSRRQSVSKPVRNTNSPIESDSLLPIGNAMFRRNIAYLLIIDLMINNRITTE
jgi:hypothetical protein